MEQAIARALDRLHRGFRQRALLGPEDDSGRRILDRTLANVVHDLTTACAAVPAESGDAPPPRRVAVAMAMALFSQPHLSSTFHRSPTDDIGEPAPRRPDEPLVVSNDVLEAALGLTQWELDDVREEVDRRAGGVLKQTTTVNWLWSRLVDSRSGPDDLYRVLFPGVNTQGAVTLVRRGGHLYALTEQAKIPPLAALYLPWLESEDEGFHPLHAFRGRYVDPGLRNALSRGIGASEPEAIALLEQCVCLLPQEGAHTWIIHDRWRHHGFAQLTTVGHPYAGTAWVTRTPLPENLHWKDWLVLDGDGGARLGDPLPTFDALVQLRMTRVLEAQHAHLLAALPQTSAEARTADEARLYDFTEHARAAIGPLLRFPRSRPAQQWLMSEGGVEKEAAAAVLDDLHAQWSTRADPWIRPDEASFPSSVMAKWMCTLATFDGAVRHNWHRPADPRWRHQDILLLFAAHYLADAPLERTLLTPSVSGASVGMAVAGWFWPTWVRLLEAIEMEAATTNPEFVVPDGLF